MYLNLSVFVGSKMFPFVACFLLEAEGHNAIMLSEVNIEFECSMNSTDSKPIFPDLSPFFVSDHHRLCSIKFLLRTALNGLRCYSELAL